MKRMCIAILTMMLFSTAVAQNRSKIRHLVRKSDIESGYLPLRYSDNENKVQPISFCFEKLYRIIRIDPGGPVIDFSVMIIQIHLTPFQKTLYWAALNLIYV
jgi:hypothetical protein